MFRPSSSQRYFVVNQWILKILQKLLKWFKGATISGSVIVLLLFGVFPVILVLYLKDLEFLMSLLSGSSLWYLYELLVVFFVIFAIFDQIEHRHHNVRIFRIINEFTIYLWNAVDERSIAFKTNGLLCPSLFLHASFSAVMVPFTTIYASE